MKKPDLKNCGHSNRAAPTIVRYAVLAAAFVLSGYPLLWMLLSAVRPDAEILQHPFALPGSLYWQNFATVMRSGQFGRAYGNSLLVCTVSVTVAVAFAAIAGFAFAKLNFAGRSVFFLLFLTGMMIPIHITLIPLNRLMGSEFLGIKNTYLALAGPYIAFALPISILILRGAFLVVPDELIESARLDGCSTLGVFWHICLPLVRPALATVVIFNFLTMWNEFVFALTFINSSSMRTLPLALWQFKGERGMFIGQTCAALCIAVLPVLLVYFFAQKQIIRGLTAGALKQ